MIVVSGTFRVASKSRAAAMKAALEMARETRKEAGCLAYAFYADLEDETVFRVFEEWQDDASLNAHFETPHMKVFRAKLAELEMLGRDVRRYVVQQTTQL